MSKTPRVTSARMETFVPYKAHRNPALTHRPHSCRRPLHDSMIFLRRSQQRGMYSHNSQPLVVRARNKWANWPSIPGNEKEQHPWFTTVCELWCRLANWFLPSHREVTTGSHISQGGCFCITRYPSAQFLAAERIKALSSTFCSSAFNGNCQQAQHRTLPECINRHFSW